MKFIRIISVFICGLELYDDIVESKIHACAFPCADHQKYLQTFQQPAIEEINSLVIDQEAEILAFGNYGHFVRLLRKDAAERPS